MVCTKMILIDSTIYAIPKNLRNVKFSIWLEVSIERFRSFAIVFMKFV